MKPRLPAKKVEEYLQYIDKRFGEENWNLKVLTAKVNQTCSDIKHETNYCTYIGQSVK